MHPYVAIAAYLMLINALAFWLYYADKRRAQWGEWRIPESSLLLAGFLGGSPAALVAQRKLRHKVRKTSFQVKFWLSVLAQGYVLAAHRDWLARQVEWIARAV